MDGAADVIRIDEFPGGRLREIIDVDVEKGWRQNLNSLTAQNCKLRHDCRRVRSHRRRDSTLQLSRVGVGGVYWTYESVQIDAQIYVTCCGDWLRGSAGIDRQPGPLELSTAGIHQNAATIDLVVLPPRDARRS